MKKLLRFRELKNKAIDLFNPEIRIGVQEEGEFALEERKIEDADHLFIELDFGPDNGTKDDKPYQQLCLAREEAKFLRDTLNKLNLDLLISSQECGACP